MNYPIPAGKDTSMHAHDNATAVTSRPSGPTQAESQAGGDDRQTILLLTQALNAKIATLDKHPPPSGWWFTPPVYFTER
jgi:hypothetical protein